MCIYISKFMYNENKVKEKSNKEKNIIQVCTMSIIEIILLFLIELLYRF